MATFISLLSFSEQGEARVRDTTKRAAAFKARAKSLGVKVKEAYWTMGHYDGVLILDAPDAETASAALLALDALGNVRTQTLRAFNAAETDAILAKAFST
jgi:uncharacterized protein with GYD domain